MKLHLQKLNQANDQSGTMRRILMVTHGTLFDEGVAKILSQRADLELWGIQNVNAYVLTQAAAEIQPDVILLFYTEPLKQRKLVTLFEAFSALRKLKIVILHHDNYTLQVFSKKHWFLLGGETFFSVIYNKPTSFMEINPSRSHENKLELIKKWSFSLFRYNHAKLAVTH